LWPLCAFIWFKNIEKMLLQMTSGFLQLESTIVSSHQRPSVSKASALKIKFADFNILYFSCFLRQAISAAAPASTEVCERYEWASVSTQVTSQMRRWPFDQRVSVAHLGVAPSVVELCNSEERKERKKQEREEIS
jgi:hypothetical protein